jgi:zinc transport system substrate-binding protein
MPCCGRAGANGGAKISVVCAFFPLYDWTRQIIGDNIDHIELTCLINTKTDLHNFQPSVGDISKVSSCDLFIYVGGESDGWAEGALKGAVNKNMRVIGLLEALGDAAKEEETLPGMEKEDEEDGEETEYDEHVWLSLKNVEKFCPVIADALALLDGGNGGIYQKNSAAYVEKLKSLDGEYMKAVSEAPVKTLLFGDRFPFRYLMDDYGLTPFAAFPGCSAETEASFETVIFLANKTDELRLKYIIVTESADLSIARTIIGNTADKNQKILLMDSMQSVTSDDIRNGAAYLTIMENNLIMLKEALS